MIKEKIEQTACVMKSTYEEFNFLWLIWHNILDFDTEAQSHSDTVYASDRPITIHFWWASIEGKRVAFVEGAGRFVDHDVIDRWISATFPDVRVVDTGNFHNCLNAITKNLFDDPVKKQKHKKIFDELLA